MPLKNKKNIKKEVLSIPILLLFMKKTKWKKKRRKRGEGGKWKEYLTKYHEERGKGNGICFFSIYRVVGKKNIQNKRWKSRMDGWMGVRRAGR